jgi:hypothetical protein
VKREEIDVFRGDLSDIKNVRPGIDGYPTTLPGTAVCKIKVIDQDGTEVVAERTVTDKMTDTDGNERFVAAILPSETTSITLPTGEASHDYTWIIEIADTNTTPPFNKEHHITLRVFEQGIT